MLSGGIGISSPGQFALAAIGRASFSNIIIPAPFNRTFFVPQNGLPWEGYKTAETNLNFSFDWSDEIGADIIVSNYWLLESTDISNQGNVVDASGSIATILLAGGISNNIYNVTNVIITQSGVKMDATFRLTVTPYNW